MAASALRSSVARAAGTRIERHVAARQQRLHVGEASAFEAALELRHLRVHRTDAAKEGDVARHLRCLRAAGRAAARPSAPGRRRRAHAGRRRRSRRSGSRSARPSRRSATGAACTTVPTGCSGSLAAKTSWPAATASLGLHEVGAALQRAAELAARHDLLARVAALLEVHAADRFVVDHLRHEGLDHRRGQRHDAAAHFAPLPERRIQCRRPAARALPAGAIHSARGTPSDG